MTVRVAVLASGGGSNLQAIIDHFRSLDAHAPGTIALVVSDRAQAGALERAHTAGIPALHIPAAALDTLLPALKEHRIDVIALAGFLRMIPADVTRAYRGRIINVHPALLPKFGGPGMYGRRVHEAVLASGDRESGVTIHHVDDQYDHGDVIAQTTVPVLADDTADTLAARVLAAEHELYPRVLAVVCAAAAAERVSLKSEV
jgi:formyltetrahydrofolate-dependent phosphoribosylglycinamide formyltransferase